MTAPDTRPEGAGPVPGEAAPLEQSREDTDAGWGEYPRPDDEWMRQERPPHWDDF